MNRLAPSIGDASLFEAMTNPGFYPNACDKVTHIETHISHVFFVGDLVYKVKKPVRYAFLDYSSLGKRRHFLQEELRLNRRWAPSVYLGVMPIGRDPSGWRLGGWNEPAEYTLVMRRLPAKRMLPFLLDTRQVGPAMIRALAERLAAFHGASERFREIAPRDYLRSLEKQWSENLTDLRPFLSHHPDREALDAVRRAGTEFIRAHENLLMRRGIDGWIRDVHGDLHAEHICFAPEGIQIFDCIEFSATLRRCDLASEMAFLSMDLAVRGGESLRAPLLDRYRELLPDAHMSRLLPFFECYRALVRAKVHALRLGHWNEEAARYFRFAQRFYWDRLKPFVVVVCGFSGSGKSTLARGLGERLGLPVYNSDVMRKRLAGTADRRVDALNRGMYRPAMTTKIYASLARAAESQVVAGRGAILDATFGRAMQRQPLARLAARRQISMLIIRCSASDAIIEPRLRLRAAHGMDISDARWDTYLAQKAAYEPIQEFTPANVFELDTDAPLDELIRRCESFLRSRLSLAMR